MEAALVLRILLNHLSVLGTVLLRVCLMMSGRVCQSSGTLSISVTAINVVVALAVSHVVAIYENQMCRIRLLDTLRHGLLLATQSQRLVMMTTASSSSVSPTQRCSHLLVVRVVLETASRRHA